jgi:hypothetical protein
MTVSELYFDGRDVMSTVLHKEITGTQYTKLRREKTH